MTSEPDPGRGPEPPADAWPEEDLAQRRPPAGETPEAATGPGPAASATGSGSEPPATEAAAEVAPPEEPAASPRPGGERRLPPAVVRAAWLAGVPWRWFRRQMAGTLASRRGKLLVVILIMGFASALTVGGVMAVSWTETADFCGRCHTMGPELKAHEISPHRELACAECHVEPGVEGWVRAKLNGTRQLFQLVTGTYPTPIPPPGHGDLPPTDQTCRRCHDADALVNNGGPVQLVLKNRYDTDEANTKSTVALVIRPAGFGEESTALGVHWHIDLDVEYSTTDRRAQDIQVVTVMDKRGNITRYVANREVTRADRVQIDLDRLITANPLERMDCIDCHNRIGHRVPPLGEAIDEAMAEGSVNPSLPFIKQQAMDTLGADYASTAAAEGAIDGIVDFYEAKYPIVPSQKPVTLRTAIDELKVIYNLVATPEMRVSASTYPDNLGHKNYPGCFRCHDGAHFKVQNGVLTDESIPSSCATCHTFPQVGTGTSVSSFLIGPRPASHTERFWLFDHKEIAAKDDGASCAACHTVTYCQNCHDSPSINVPHDNILFDHPGLIDKLGGTASCALCHQPTYCERCHPRGVPGFSSNPPPDDSPH